MKMFRSVTGLIVALIAIVTVLAATVGATFIRKTPAPVRIAGDVNIERVADEFRIVNLGEKSVYVPADQGGTGQRFMAEVWSLQQKDARGYWMDLIWAWGTTDDVVPFLQAKQREHQTSIDAMMFNQPGYVPKFQFNEF